MHTHRKYILENTSLFAMKKRAEYLVINDLQTE